MKTYIFVPNKKGHYREYASFLTILLKESEVIIVDTFKQKLKAIFRRKSSIIFLDIDANPDYLWLLFRFIISKRNFGVSVSAETLLDKKFTLIYWNKGKKRLLKKFIKYKVLQILNISNRLQLISIHKDTVYENELKKIVCLSTYDFQYYDLNYLKYSLDHLVDFDILEEEKKKKTVLIVNNTSTAKKNLSELREWIISEKNLFFIIVGNNEFLNGEQIENTLLINRYVTNEELIYLMKNSTYIYCFYTNNRPSGFMGRAMQLRKKVIIPTNGYLSTIPYPLSIKLDKLIDFVDNIETTTNAQFKNFDESNKVKTLLLKHE